MSVARLSFPKKSHRKAVAVPKDSEQLAELFGIMLGDGGINNPWQANVTLNADADASYSGHVACLFEVLFGVLPAVRRRKGRRAIVVSLSSIAAVDFLVRRGLPRGNKLEHGLSIPAWILRKKKYKIACVRGLVDTDGCAVLHKHRIAGKVYMHVYVSLSSGSQVLLSQVAKIFADCGISPCFSSNGREIWIYSKTDVEKYMRIFGTANDRISSVYKKGEMAEWSKAQSWKD